MGEDRVHLLSTLSRLRRGSRTAFLSTPLHPTQATYAGPSAAATTRRDGRLLTLLRTPSAGLLALLNDRAAAVARVPIDLSAVAARAAPARPQGEAEALVDGSLAEVPETARAVELCACARGVGLVDLRNGPSAAGARGLIRLGYVAPSGAAGLVGLLDGPPTAGAAPAPAPAGARLVRLGDVRAAERLDVGLIDLRNGCIPRGSRLIELINDRRVAALLLD